MPETYEQVYKEREELRQNKTLSRLISEDVLRSCLQFIPADAMSATSAMEKLAKLNGLPVYINKEGELSYGANPNINKQL